MKRTATNFFVMTALVALGATAAMACPLAYAINFSGQFGIIDLATGVFTPLGKGLDNTPDGIAGAPGGPFYTVDGFNGHLLKIGLDGKVTDVGDTKTGPNVGPIGVSVIGSLTDGTLYALDFGNRLFRVNPNNASMTLVGTLPLPPQESDYSGNMVTSLNGNATQLFYTLEIREGPRKTGPTLYTINPANLSITKHDLRVSGLVIGSGMVNGGLYLFGADGEIFKLNTATGDVTFVAGYDSGITEDGPPVTGVFGVIAGIEPNHVKTTHSRQLETHSLRSLHWPPRYAPIPAHGNQ